jgi:hypothetical protein
MVQEYQDELELNRTHQLLAYTVDVKIVGENGNTINKNMEALLEVSREDGLEINVQKTKYVVVSPSNCRTKPYLLTANKSFENVANLKHF